MRNLNLKDLVSIAYSKMKGPILATFCGLLVGAVVILIC